MNKVYGIDLGTTNSLIGRGEELYTGLVSSSVDIAKKKQVNRDDISKDIVSSYKVNMTTGESGQLPMACSAIVLRELADRASREVGEPVTDVVISVPAKFSHTQRQATWNAAVEAGLNMRGLINEPTAAAIYVCRDYKDLVLVYDLGGGTFDISILDVRMGNYYVLATDGDGYLAGDNFDNALADYIIKNAKIKMRYRSPENIKLLTREVRLAKEAMQKSGKSVDINLMMFEDASVYTLTLDVYKKVMKEVFAPTIKLTKTLLQTSVWQGEKPKIIFVGGSTACPYLREWVTDEIGLEEIKYDLQPDYTVAKGVAYYAKMVEDGVADKEVEDVTKCLCIENSNGMSDVVIEKNTNIPVSETRTFVNTEDTQYLIVKLYQGDNILCSSNEYIGTLEYDYGNVRKAGDGVVDIEITVDHDGRVKLSCTDILTCITQSIDLVIK